MKNTDHSASLPFRLIPYEIRKVFSSPFPKIFAVSLLILNILMCAYASYTPGSEVDTYYDAVYKLYLDDPEYFFAEYDRIKKASAELDPFEEQPSAYGGGKYDDLALFRHVYDIVTADEKYHEELEELISKASRLRRNYETTGNGDSCICRYQTRVIDIYSRLDETVTLGDSEVSGWNEFFSYHADYFLVFILISALTSFIALGDRISGAHTVIGTCRLGRSHTVAAKYIAALILSAAAVTVFTSSTFISAGIAAGGLSDMTAAVQSVQLAQSMNLYPARVTLGGALAVDLLLKLLSASVFTSVVFFAAMLTKNAVISTGLGVGALTLCYFGSFADVLKTDQWKYLNLWSVYYSDQYMARFRAVDICGRCVDLIFVFALICAVSLTAFPLLSCALANTRGASMGRLAMIYPRSSARGKARRGNRRTSLSVSFYEICKQRAAALLFLALIVLKIISSADYYGEGSTVYDRAYQKYIDEIKGEWNEEKAQKLRGDREYCEKIITGFDQIGQAYWNGEMTEGEFQKLYAEYLGASTKINVLDELISRSDYLKELYETRGVRGSFVYDTGYNKAANQGTDALLLLFVCVFSVRIYLCEYRKTASGTPMLMITAVTKRGRSYLFRRKLILCLTVSAFSWFAFRLADVFFFLRSYELPDMSASILSMPRYGETAFDLTVAKYTALTAIVSLIGTLTLSLLCLALGIWIKRAIAAYAVAAAVLAVPALAVRTGITAAGYFDLTALYDADRLYITSPTFLTPPTYGVCIFAAAVCAAVSLTVYFHRRSEAWGL